MFQSSTGLPHLLPPTAYRERDWAERERLGPLYRAWHLVGDLDQLSKPGDFLTAQLLGHPIQVRRFEQGLVALSNVCSHRHCLISSKPSGNQPSMRCQYHGWEFGHDGKTRKIPEAKDLAPIDPEQLRIAKYSLATCGQLVFVRLSGDGPDLESYLGPLAEKFRLGFGEGTRCFMRWSTEYDANWKVSIENSLEAYHVASVHPNTFRRDPGEARSEHVLEARHTAFGTDLPFVHSKTDDWFLRIQGLVLRILKKPVTRRYWQHHLFPNLLASFTDAISLVHCVVPIGLTRSRSLFLQYGPSTGVRSWTSLIANAWGRFEAGCTKRILEEDIELYPKIQAGLNFSNHAGRLARSEERIYQFQQYLLEQLSDTSSPIPSHHESVDSRLLK